MDVYSPDRSLHLLISPHQEANAMADIKTPLPAVDEKENFMSNDFKTDLSPLAVAVEIAEEVDNNKYSPWTWSMLRLYAVLFVAYCCGCLNEYDGSLMEGLNGMNSYQRTFNMYVEPPCEESADIVIVCRNGRRTFVDMFA